MERDQDVVKISREIMPYAMNHGAGRNVVILTLRRSKCRKITTQNKHMTSTNNN